jgi:hypothetical protein
MSHRQGLDGRSRWATYGLASVALEAGAGGWAVDLRPSVYGWLVLLSATGLALGATGVVARQPRLSAWAITLIAAAFLTGESARPVEVVVPAAFAVVLLASAELAWRSAELATTRSWEPGTLGRRWWLLGALCLGGFAVAVLCGLVGVVALGAGSSLVLLGGAGFLALGALVVSAVLRLGR